jgi:hypothetical protein
VQLLCPNSGYSRPGIFFSFHEAVTLALRSDEAYHRLIHAIFDVGRVCTWTCTNPKAVHGHRGQEEGGCANMVSSSCTTGLFKNF